MSYPKGCSAEDEVPPVDYVVASFDGAPAARHTVVRVEGEPSSPKVSFVSQDFLGLDTAPGVRESALETLDAYSVGSCGPRGFYGTTIKHLDLEAAIASFMGTPESISYSDSASTIASAIPAFAKRGDVLLLDGGACASVLAGARLSRSKVLAFKHNDMADLQRALQGVRSHDARSDDSTVQRRFIVVEGLYANHGDVCPLPEVLALAREYKWRVIVDDSLGVGVLGATGRGVTEHFKLPSSSVDVLVGSLSTALASVGGFCVGAREVVDHQRLSGSGYW